ncbi:non-ribosomal peptide synthetase [Armatimonas rosea]|uniref:Acyl-coenzyme A synthetase/AMP-(Fatty) acid ligase/thioesterase domain-containing protein n=1 Tax=Armatimonas rosea TaxID=685828 RepID=A0A7W9SWB6_ARMRO|nr:non-ribosomal peptide synthetase [Armatimonas rosea]MBB6053409.1 acyl-coenzyme A synthetase/AMP-(fatty) acid ligase/thioesterase domain-containing protein [Armatimonas rosea]
MLYSAVLHAIQRHPRRLALRDAHLALTFAELRDAIAIVASALPDLAPGSPVAILSPTDTLSIVGALAVLSRGYYYVPLSPTSPPAYLAQLQQQVGFEVALVGDGVTASLPVDIPAIPLALTGGATVLPINTREPSSGAALFFTSGTTGTPKGVLYTDSQLCFDAARQQRALSLYEHDAFDLQFAGWFSASVACVYPALLSGASLHLYDIAAEGVTALPDWLRQRQITISNMVTSVFRQLTQQLSPEETFPTLRLLSLSAELVTPQDIVLFDQFFPAPTTLQVAYASSEARTITQWLFRHGEPIPPTMVPLGTAVEGKRVLIVDPGGKTIAPRALGEICVQSAHIPEGYFGHEHSPVHRVSTEGVQFATGDLGFVDDDGTLWLTGRKDRLLKINGVRIQPEVIEQAANALAGIQEGYAIEHEQAGLVLFYTHAKSALERIPPDEVLSQLQAVLPDYLVPKTAILLNEIPRTPNGKADLLALRTLALPSEPSDPPQTPDERQLAELWERVLGCPVPSRNVSFFALGGTSLQAAHVMSLIQKQWGMVLPVQVLIGAPTLQALALFVSTPTSWSCLVPLQPEGSLPPLFCVHALGANVLNYRLLALALGKDQPLYGLQASGLNPTEAPHRSVEVMAAAYISEIRGVQPKGPYYLAGGSSGGIIAYEMAQQLLQSGEEVAVVVLIDTYHLQRSWLSRWGYFLRLVGRLTHEPTTRRTKYITCRNWLALSRYRPCPLAARVVQLLACPVDAPGSASDSRLAWGQLVTSGFQVVPFVGTHAEMLNLPTVDTVAEQLRACLAEAHQHASP